MTHLLEQSQALCLLS